MKKLMIALAFVGLGLTAMAQETTVPVKKYSVATNSFWANWFVQAGYSYTAAYSSQEHLSGNAPSYNPFNGDRGTHGFTVAIGKWFTPGIGLRTKMDAFKYRNVIAEGATDDWKYWNIHEDVLFNLSNIFCGYNRTRVWNTSIYPSVGVVHNMSTRANHYDFSFGGGWLNTWRLADHWNIFLDINYMFATGDVFQNGIDDFKDHDKCTARHWDRMLNAQVGLTYNLGKCTWDKVPDVDALMAMNKEQMDALNAALKDQQDENARLRDLLANQKPAQTVTKTEKELVGTACSVFFDINKSEIASRKDLVNVKEVADYAKANNAKLVVTGYADSKTGSADYNKALSQKRAEAVADELVKMGVNRDNIIVKSEGGVDVVSPFSYNRRATVKVQ
ncbi:MAG: OmpA family protein [Bacteroidales bacterium]|nr:OmpA family protein [Candidatus Equimonas enterica]